MVERARRRGSVLIVALGVMAILVVLAVMFARVTTVERQISRNYVDLVRAKLLAQSGIEAAFKNIGNMFFWGNDGLDNDGDGLVDEPDEQRLSIAEDTNIPYLYGRRNPLPILYSSAIPIERARYVSFQRPDNPNTQIREDVAAIDVGNVADNSNLNLSLMPTATGDIDLSTPLDERRHFGISGEVVPTYLGGRDYYALKIVDCQSGIYINGPDMNDTNPDPAVARTVDPLAPNTLLMLNTLGSLLSSPIPNLGDAICAFRRRLGVNIATKQALKEGLQLTDAQYDALAPHITTVAWIDYTTLHPNALQTHFQVTNTRPNDPTPLYNRIPICQSDSETAAQDGEDGNFFEANENCLFSCAADRLVSHGPGYYAPHWHTYTNTAENRTNTSQPNGPCIQPRAPVNVNTASQLVLRALLTGLRGRYQLYEAGVDQPQVYMGDGHTAAQETFIDATVALNVADAIIARRDALITARGFGFATWYDFEQFVDELPDTTMGATGAIAQARRDIIKANFNPNSKISKFNPDRCMGLRFAQTDKADLLSWTTEFCFNSGGVFEIESLGRVLGPSRPVVPGSNIMVSPIMAEKKVLTMVRAYDIIKHSTQAQFYVNAVGATSAPTDVTYYPESMTDHNTPTQTAAYSYLTGNPAPSQIPNFTMAAHYDGYLGAGQMDSNGANCPPNQYQAHYTTDFDFYLSGTIDQNDSAGPAEEGVSLINAGTDGGGDVGGQSELFPDGLFVHETRRYPTYTDTQLRYGANHSGTGNVVDDYVRNTAFGKIFLQAGTLDMWVKPTWAAFEFPSRSSTGTQEPNPSVIGSRTMFSFGYGSNAWPYQHLNGGTYTKDLDYCDNRVVIAARSRGGNDQHNVFMFGWMGSRLADAPFFTNGGGLTIPGTSQPMIDLFPYWGQISANFYHLPSNTPEPFYTATHTWNPRNWTHPGVWHHLRLVWEGGRTGRLFVDGMADSSGAITSGRTVPVFPGNSFGNSATQEATDSQVDQPHHWSLFPGTNRFQRRTTNGYVCSADATLDDIQILDYAVVAPTSASFTPPHRFAALTTYEARIGPPAGNNGLNPAQTAFPPVGPTSSGRVVMIAWTARFPKFTNCSSNITFTVSSTNPPLEVVVSPTLPGGWAQELQGRGVPINVPYHPTGGVGAELRYRATFDLTQGPPGTPPSIWRSATPHLDDVTLLVLPASATMLYYAME